MGRYYNGDINGKFWFAVQSSDSPSRFGGFEYGPNYINYEFEAEHLEKVEVEIQNIENTLGEYKKTFDEFFDKNNGYNNETLEIFFKKKKIDTSKKQITEMLSEYADLGLGKEIRDCIKHQGFCNFQAEC